MPTNSGLTIGEFVAPHTPYVAKDRVRLATFGMGPPRGAVVTVFPSDIIEQGYGPTGHLISGGYGVPTTAPPKGRFGRTRLSVRRMNESIKEHGEWVTWYQAVKCPCGTSLDSSRSLVTCAACSGTGWLYRAPAELVGQITDVRIDRQLVASGLASAGDLLFSPTFRDGLPQISNYDKIILQWAEGLPFDGDLIPRAAVGGDLLSYIPLDVQQCLSVNPTTGAITDYVWQTDFVINGRKLIWETTHAPAPGTLYSIKYTPQLEWIAQIPGVPRYERGTPLGQRVVLKLRHLVFK